MTPLTDLKSGKYLGFEGGLYPNGENSPPIAYEEAGATLGATVRPLDKDGKPSGSGRIVMISIGMSNASHEFLHFIRLVEADPRKNPSLVMIDAAREGAAATEIAIPFGEYWSYVDSRLQACDISAAQVQIIWLKTALRDQPPGFPEKAQLLQRMLCSVVEILGTRFPQLKLIYVSSRTYGGYSKIELSREPIAYESAFAVKWLIEAQIKHPNRNGRAPWVSWGPYLWANGLTPRSDGLIWERSDFEPDGVHPSAQGALKVAKMLLEFFRKDAAAKPWVFSALI